MTAVNLYPLRLALNRFDRARMSFDASCDFHDRVEFSAQAAKFNAFLIHEVRKLIERNPKQAQRIKA